jgi:hypothetical protein
MCFHNYHKITRTPQRDNLKQIKDLGFDVIQTEESPVAPGNPPGPLAPVMAWNHIEIGKGKYDWGFIDRLVEDCEAVGLKLLHDIEIVHHLPTWIARKYSDTDVILPTGEHVRPHHWRLCYSDLHMRCYSLAHPACRAAAADFMHKVAERYAGSSAVVGYIVVEERGLNSPEAQTWNGQDVSPAAIAGFEQYLKQTYGTLANLNRRYERKYSSFADAASDRSIFDIHLRPHRGWMDWTYYRCAYVSSFFRGVRDAIKQADPEALVIASAIGGDGAHCLAQGCRDEDFGFMDIVATKSACCSPGRQPYLRNSFSVHRSSRTEVGISNLNDAGPHVPTWDLARKIFLGLGFGTRWNVLYAWHWYAYEDSKTGKWLIHDNLRDFLPYVKWIREHREFLGDLRPEPAQIALLKPVRSEIIEYWHQNDPRVLRQSHPGYTRAFTWVGSFKMQDLLSEENIPFDTIAEEHLAEALDSGSRRMLVVGDAYLTEPVARLILAWVKKGGKLLLLPGAGRFDEAGNKREYFQDLIKEQKFISLLYRDFTQWQKDAAFPKNAKVLLTLYPSIYQLPYLLKWAGIKRPLELVEPPQPTRIENGTVSLGKGTDCAYMWAAGTIPYQHRLNIYPMLDSAGHRLFVLIQRGADQTPLKNVPVIWKDGPVRLWRPPSPKSVRVVPSSGKLVLPTWRDVAILVPESIRKK